MTQNHLTQSKIDYVGHQAVNARLADKTPVDLNPNLLIYLMSITAKLRWDETNEMPQTRVSIVILVG